jgi:hypothetical protein
MKRRLRALVTAAMLAAVYMACLSGANAVGAESAESIVVNGSFQKWTDGAPDGWTVEIGATNGAEAPKSVVQSIKGPALMLRGDASTMAWHSVSQELPVQLGGKYRLEFETRTKDIRREGRQFNNCYVGVMSMDGSGKPIAPKIEDVAADSAEWKKHRVDFAVPQSAKSTKLLVFLSKSGILGVKNVCVTPLDGSVAPTTESTSAAPAQPSSSLLTNGDFTAWTNGRPDGWKVDIGASNGASQPTSEITKLSDPGLALRGVGSTMAWYSLEQEVAVRKGGTYSLEFQAMSKGIQRQGRQFDNCYVGVMCLDGAGKKIDAAIKDLSRVPRWTKQKIDFRVPQNAAKTQVLIFLSKTGTLSVKDLRIQEATPGRPFRGSRR